MKRQRFVFLDGLRGLAALAVMGFHAGAGLGLKLYPVHGYLAVDFFFCLSGFVLAQAYDSRLAAGMNFSSFAAIRIARLYPMLFAAGILALVASPEGGAAASAWQLPLLRAADFTLLPFGLLFHHPAYPLDGPIWSLFFEFLASFLFFLDPTRPVRAPALSLALLGCFGSALALILVNVGSASVIGFSSPAAFLAGFPRVMFSFTAGVLLHRFVPYQRLPRLPAWLLLLAMLALFCGPSGKFDAAYDLAAIFICFPLFVALGANVPDHGRYSPLWRFAGQLSYPLYVIHQPVLSEVHALLLAHDVLNPVPAAVCGAAAALLLAYVLLVCYDAPLRSWLTQKHAVRLKPI